MPESPLEPTEVFVRDLDDLVSRCRGLPLSRLVEVLREDQVRRWRSGQRYPAEAYLAAFPDLAASADDALVLVWGEVLLRLQSGESPAPAEYQARFPRHAEALAMQFELQRYLDTEPQPTTPETTSGASPELPRVPGFDILGELGRGGIGVVYKACQLSLDRIVALKVLLAGGYADEDERSRFRAEAQAVARLRHPNIVQVHEVGEQDGHPYLVMEYLEGGSLRDHLAGTPLNAQSAATLTETLARAVDAAHREGIVHRDLKPANILLASGGRKPPVTSPSQEERDVTGGLRPPLASLFPKITDFGLAKRLDVDAGQTPSGAVMGTPSYMPPEQAAGKARAVGPAADVYSLGAVLYELLTGRPPFQGETPLDTLQQVLFVDPVVPRALQPKTPRDIETICLKCLQKEPEERYASALALADDLHHFLAGEPIRARPIGPAGRLYRWCRRRPAVAGLLGLVLALAVGAFSAVTALWLRAERLRVQAERDRADAVADYQLARDSIEGYAVRVSDDLRLREEDLRPLRKKLLETVVPFYERLVERHADQPEVQAERGKAYQRLAAISAEIDDKARAIPLYEKAIPLLEEQLQLHPGDRDRIRAVTECRVLLAGLYHLTGRSDEARAEYQRLLTWQKQLVQDHPDDAQYLEDLAHNHNELAVLCSDERRPEALAEQEEAVRLQAKLADAHPEVESYRQRLASYRTSLALLYRAVDTRRAEDEYNRAVSELEPLAAKDPKQLSPQRELAVTLSQLGRLYADTARTAQAIAPCERAVHLLEAVVRQSPSVTETRLELGQSLAALAAAYLEVGRADDAEGLFGRAIAQYQELRQQNPQVRYYRFNLAVSRKQLGYLYFGTGNLDKAEEQFRQAVAPAADLAHEDPSLPDYADEQAIDRMNLAAIYQKQGRPALAEAEYEAALALLRPLVAGPTADRHRGTFAACRTNLATLCYRTDRLTRAEELYREALHDSESLVRAHPDHREEALTLAKIDSSLGTVALARGDAAVALPWFDRSAEVALAWLQRDPAAIETRRLLRDVRVGRVRTLSRLGRHADALKECEEALAIDTGQPRDSTRALRALTQARLGQWTAALAEADEVSRSLKLSGTGCYDLACTYALKSAAGMDDDLHANRAVEMLQRAKGAGHFNGVTFVEQLKKDADFDSLRKREDFRQLLAELEKKSSAP